jgi:hypothetical protein
LLTPLNKSLGGIKVTSRVAIAIKLLSPLVAIQLLVEVVTWGLVPDDSWLTYAGAPVVLLVLPWLAGARLTRAGFARAAAVFSSLLFALVSIIWVACAVALGHGGGDWRVFYGFLIASATFGIPVQFVSAYLAVRFTGRRLAHAT